MKRHGTTLIEVLIGMGLLMSIMAMTAALMREYNRVIRFDSQRQALLEVSQLCLTRMSDEALSSVEFVTPALGTVSLPMGGEEDSLSFRALRPNLTDRLPASLDPLNPPATWPNLAPGDLQLVNYNLVSSQLLRQVDSNSKILGERISGFSVRFESKRQLELSLSVNDNGRVIRRTKIAFLPVVLE